MGLNEGYGCSQAAVGHSDRKKRSLTGRHNFVPTFSDVFYKTLIQLLKLPKTSRNVTAFRRHKTESHFFTVM
jgi:hypothetical protein